MIDSNLYYVWDDAGKQCWIPLPEKKVPENLYVTSNVIHVPPPPNKKEYIEKVEKKIENIVARREKIGKKALESGEDIFSADDPRKHKLAKKFLQGKGDKIILYGGTAIDLNLPMQYKIYESSELPDYDVYSPDPFNLAVEMSEYLHSNGYDYVEVRSGIHAGTFKVYANLWPVLDSTYMPKKVFYDIPTVEIKGLNVADTDYLLKNMYKEFGETFSNPERYGKVAYRAKLLEYTHPSKMKDVSEYLVADPNQGVSSAIRHLLKRVYLYGRDNKAVFYGPYAYNKYIVAGNGNLFLKYNNHKFLTTNADNHSKDLRAIIANLTDDDVTVECDYQADRQINKTSYTIAIGSYPLCTITNLDVCTPRQYRGIYIADIDYMKFELYLATAFGDKTMTAALIYLSNLQNRYYEENDVTEFDKGIFGRFSSLCTGPYKHNIKHTVFNRMVNMLEERDNVRVIKPKEDSITIHGVKDAIIRIYPKTTTSKECKNKIKGDCTYPCFWNPDLNDCYDIPTSIYRPGMKDLEQLGPDEEGIYDPGWG